MVHACFVFILMLFPFLLFPQESNKEVEYHLNAGSTSSISIVLHNPSAVDVEFDVSASSSTNKIQILTANTKSKVSANERKIYIVPIRISLVCEAGTHYVMVKSSNTKTKEEWQQRVKLIIATSDELSISSLDGNEYVHAGDTITSLFLVKNEGNISQDLVFKSNQGLIGNLGRVTFAPQEEKVIVVNKYTNRNQGEFTLVNIDLHVSRAGDEERIASAYHGINVIPIKPKNIDPYQRMPVHISLMYLTMKNQGEILKGFQGELHTRTSFAKDFTDDFELRAVSKNPIEFNAFTQYEEYFARYSNQKISVHLGDKLYSSSFLTEFARYGRGAEVQYNIGRLAIGSFYNKPRFFKDIKDEYNVYAKLLLREHTSIMTGYLRKNPITVEEGQAAVQIQNIAHLPYTTFKTSIFKRIDLEGEYSYSKMNEKRGDGYRLQGSTNSKYFGAHINYLNTSPDYAGYFQNSNVLNAGIRVTLFSRLQWSANHYQDARDFQRDTLLHAAPFRQQSQSALQYVHSKKGNMSVTYGFIKYEDRLTPQLFNYDETFIRLSLTQRFGFFKIETDNQLGKTSNHITLIKGNSRLHNINLGIEKPTLSLVIFGSVANTVRYQDGKNEQYFYGGKWIQKFSDRSFLNLSYQNNYIPEDYYKDRNQFEGIFQQKIGDKHQLELSGRYMLQRGSIGHKDFIASVKYTTQVNLPIRKIAEYSTLTGNVKNLGIDKIEGIRLRLGSHIAVVDRHGDFVFKNVVPGRYYLDIDRSTMAMNVVSDEDFPRAIDIEEKVVNTFYFGLIKSAVIHFRINLIEETTETKKSSAFLQDNNLQQTENFIIELSNGVQTYYKITTINSTASFTHLRPGVWTMRLRNMNSDSKYKIKDELLDVNLEADTFQELQVGVTRKNVEVRFQKEILKVGYKDVK